MMFTEIVAVILVTGALVLVGLGRLTFEQAISIITLGVGLVAGKYVAKFELYALKRRGPVVILFKFTKQLSSISVDKKTGTIRIGVIPDYYDSKHIRKIMEYATLFFPGQKIEIVKEERVKLV
ncbi:MAG: hypothetical protein NZ957_05730 [Thaumarchaeota archaeon]|nr:hypothetical protein [Candidatus Calditenuaceae archaeon]